MTKPETKKVKLKKDHIHKGKEYKIGETIEVTLSQVDWLKALQVI